MEIDAVQAWPDLTQDQYGQVLSRNIQQHRQRSFHRLGVAIAGAIIAVGLALIGAAVIRLDLLETLGADTFAIVAGFTLVLLGAIAIATYGVVRAIEWASRR